MEVTNLDEQKCNMINEILEDHFIIGKKGKEQIIGELTTKLNITNDEADKIYNTCMQVIGREIKNKLKNPFKSQD